MTAVEKMYEYASNFNDKDCKLARQFIKDRKFDSLYELLNSNIYKLVKKKDKEPIDDLKLDTLRDYRIIVTEYLSQLDYDFSHSDYIDDYEEFEGY